MSVAQIPEPRAPPHCCPPVCGLHYWTAGSGPRVAVLLHGWPQTAWQWRPRRAAAGRGRLPRRRPRHPGCRTQLAPAPGRRHPGGPPRRGSARAGYDKWSIAEDVHLLLHDELGISEPALVVGHDIGSMIATAYALRYRSDVRALCVGEAPLRGTQVFDEVQHTPPAYHFLFHQQLDLPEALVAGREQVYLQHFVEPLGYRPTAVDVDHYVRAYSHVGALRAGFDLYRAFEAARPTRARPSRRTAPSRCRSSG